MPVEQLGLSARTLNCLKRAGINRVGEVVALPKSDLLKIRNFGQKSLDELHLATLDSAEARLSIELNVEQGIGYVAASNETGLPIGVLPVDAIYSPIRKSNFKVEPCLKENAAGGRRSATRFVAPC